MTTEIQHNEENEEVKSNLKEHVENVEKKIEESKNEEKKIVGSKDFRFFKLITEEDSEGKKTKSIEVNRGIIFDIIASVCIIMYCCAMAPKILQNDTFYTVTVGEYIYNNGISDLTKDLYSWHNIPYTYPHWLYDLGMFMIYNTFGQKGIYGSTMILASILGLSVYGLCRKKAKNKIISAVVTIGVMYLIKDFIAARAQLATFVLFAWEVLAIEAFLETGKKRYAAILIILPLIITNLHCAVFPFYFVLFLPYIAEYLLLSIADMHLDMKLVKLFYKIRMKLTKNEEKKNQFVAKLEEIKAVDEKRTNAVKRYRENPYKVKVEKNNLVLLLITIMAIAALTGFLNPAGNGAYTYLYKTMQGNTMGSINEHLPLTLSDAKEFALSLIVFLIILIFTDTKIKLHDLFMLCGITFLAFKSRRQVSMYGIFCGPILASLISQFIDKYDRLTFEKLERYATGWFGSLVIICLAIIINVNIIKPHISQAYIDVSSYPVDACDWMIENLDYKNIKLYNEYNYGSYILFRGIPVFIDSRCDLYTPEFNGDPENGIDGRDIFSDALNIAGLSVDYKTKFKSYGVTHVILYENAKLAMILANDPDYKTIYREGNFRIFERINAANENDALDTNND